MLTSVGEASTSDNEKNLDSVIRNEVMLHSSTVTASTAELRTSVTVNCKNSRNIVKFSSIEIREYGYTLGNHPGKYQEFVFAPQCRCHGHIMMSKNLL